jgi:hypothetical protein
MRCQSNDFFLPTLLLLALAVGGCASAPSPQSVNITEKVTSVPAQFDEAQYIDADAHKVFNAALRDDYNGQYVRFESVTYDVVSYSLRDGYVSMNVIPGFDLGPAAYGHLMFPKSDSEVAFNLPRWEPIVVYGQVIVSGSMGVEVQRIESGPELQLELARRLANSPDSVEWKGAIQSLISKLNLIVPKDDAQKAEIIQLISALDSKE